MITAATLVVPLTLLDVFFLPGLGIVRRWFRDADGVETVALALLFGTCGVGFTSFVIAAIAQVWLTPTIVLGVANVVNLLHAPVWLRELRGLRVGTSSGPALLRAARRALVLVALPWLLFALRFSRDEFDLTCVNYAPAYVTGVKLGDGSFAPADRNDVLRLDLENQEGNAPLIAAFPALFEYLGYRLAFATNALTGFLLAFSIGRRLGGGRDRYGWLYALVLYANPIVLSMRSSEENLLCMTALLGALALLSRERPSFFGAGLCFAWAFGCRHILILGAGGLVAHAWLSRDRVRALASLAAGFALPASYFAAHHWLTFGSLLAHEHLRHFPEPVPHRFLGVDFAVHTLLAWPFTDALRRSPFNPVPTLVQYALALPIALGTALTAVGALGAGVLARLDRRQLCLVAGIGLPTLAILAVQGNWSETEKIRLIVTPLAALALPIVAGAVWLSRAPRKLGWLALVAGLAWLQIPLARTLLAMRFEVEPREYVGRPTLPVETPADEAFMRRVVLREPRPWPGLSRRDLIETLVRSIFSVRDLAEEVSDPRYEARTLSIAQQLSGVLLPELHRHTQYAHVSWRAPEPLPPAGGADRRWIEVRLDRPPVESGADWVLPAAPPASPGSGEALVLDGSSPELLLPARTATGLDGPHDVAVLRSVVRDDERTFIALIRRSATSTAGAATTAAIEGDRLLVELGPRAHVALIHFLHLQPLIAEAWDVELLPDDGLEVTPSSF